MWSPSLNASPIVMPAPGTSGFAPRHALKCSSDRKKLRVVQTESQARRHSASARFPTHTMTPAASGSGPGGSLNRVKGMPQW
jgi:hypothetical protein